MAVPVACSTLAFGLMALGSSGAAASSRGNARVGLKTGWIYEDVVTDKGYDEEWYNAQLYLEKTLGIKAQYVQSEPYTSQWTATALSMAAAGAKLLVDVGGGGSLFYAACDKLPKVACVETDAVKPFPSNVTAVFSQTWDTSYLEGIAAGMLTKTGVIGWLEGYSTAPSSVRLLNALVLGCQVTHPGCRAIADVVNSWYNPPVETEDLNALVDAHADVLAGNESDPSTVVVAQKRGVWGIPLWADPVSSGPKAFISAAVANYGPTLLKITKQVIKGTYKGGSIDLFGFGQGLSLAPFGPDVPQAVKTRVATAEAQMKAGHNFFCGPIYSNTGVLKVKAGSCLSALQMYGWSTWYVKGVSISK
jgi:basic membrane protein A